MSDITRILSEVEAGTPGATEQLLPLVYEELRAIAARKMAHERPGATLQATALVHEAYLRLVGSGTGQHWSHQGHFFSSAAEAMRRILVEIARSNSRQKRGGNRVRQELRESAIESPVKSDQILAVHDALERLEHINPQATQLVNLRYFAGFTNREAAEALGISPRKADQLWAYARVWLAAEVSEDDNAEP